MELRLREPLYGLVAKLSTYHALFTNIRFVLAYQDIFMKTFSRRISVISLKIISTFPRGKCIFFLPHSFVEMKIYLIRSQMYPRYVD